MEEDHLMLEVNLGNLDTSLGGKKNIGYWLLKPCRLLLRLEGEGINHHSKWQCETGIYIFSIEKNPCGNRVRELLVAICTKDRNP